jgi:tetratricopeptide (TPR) repeat protein
LRSFLASLFSLAALAAVDGQNEIGQITSNLRSGQYEQAAALADSLLRTEPRDYRVLTLKAIALTKLNREKEAESSFLAALAAKPDYVPALAGAAELEYLTGSDTALRHVDKLLELRPDDQTAHAMRAEIAWQRRDCPAAIQHFEAAPNAVASQASALRQFGICLVLANRPAEAVKPFEEARALEPSNRRTLLDLAYAQITANQNQAALETLSSELSQPHPSPDVLAIASEAYENTGDTPHAVTLLRQAIVEAPSHQDLYLRFASLCFEHKAFAIGADMLTAGLSQLPQAAPLYLARGVLYAQMGEYEKADADFERAQTLDPNEPSGPGAKALAYLQAGSLDEAMKTVRASLASHPSDSYLRYLLAEILLKKGAAPGSADFAEALASARKAVQLQPSSNLARDVLSRLYLASGNPNAAIEQCRRALANDPADQMAIYRLIRALNAAGSSSRTEIAELTRRLGRVRQAEQAREQQVGRFRLEEVPVPQK